MEKMVAIEVSAAEAAQVDAEIARYFAEIERSQERMKQDQAEIVRLKTRTRAMLAELAQLRTT